MRTWIYKKDKYHRWWECPHCGARYIKADPGDHCPRCGRKMDMDKETKHE